MLWIVLLGIICLILLIYLISLKKQLMNIRRELDRTSEASYDRRITIQLFDKSTEELCASINRCIDHQKQLKAEAERSEVQLRRAVSDIAHDLRTPLSVIKGDLQLVLREEELSEKAEGYIRTCLEKTERLKNMSDEFFELSVLESDSTPIKLKKLNLTNLIMKFFAENESLIRLSDLTPEIDLPAETVFVMADEQMVMRMLLNLLGNIIKYSKNHFTFKLSANGSLRISNPVDRDNIPETDKLFERTYRGDSARSGNGAGLGLYIVKLLAQKQNAQVSAEISNGELAVTVDFLIDDPIKP